MPMHGDYMGDLYGNGKGVDSGRAYGNGSGHGDCSVYTGSDYVEDLSGVGNGAGSGDGTGNDRINCHDDDHDDDRDSVFYLGCRFDYDGGSGGDREAVPAPETNLAR